MQSFSLFWGWFSLFFWTIVWWAIRQWWGHGASWPASSQRLLKLPHQLAMPQRWEKKTPHPHLLPPWRLHLTNPRHYIKYHEIISVISMEICFQIITPPAAPFLLHPLSGQYVCHHFILKNSIKKEENKEKEKGETSENTFNNMDVGWIKTNSLYNSPCTLLSFRSFKLRQRPVSPLQHSVTPRLSRLQLLLPVCQQANEPIRPHKLFNSPREISRPWRKPCVQQSGVTSSQPPPALPLTSNPPKQECCAVATKILRKKKKKKKIIKKKKLMESKMFLLNKTKQNKRLFFLHLSTFIPE